MNGTLTLSPAHSLTHSLTHLLAHSLTYLLTHSLTQYLTHTGLKVSKSCGTLYFRKHLSLIYVLLAWLVQGWQTGTHTYLR